MTPVATALRPTPDDPCESCQRAPAAVTAPCNAVGGGGGYEIRLCGRCAALLPDAVAQPLCSP